MTNPTTITLPREKLLPALSLVHRAIERRTTIPILANMLVEADSGTLTLAGTNLDQEMRATAEADMTGPARFTLPGALLFDAVRKLPEGAEVSIAADDQVATVSAGRARFRLPVLPATDFPTITEGELAYRFTLPGETLAEMLAMTSFAISSEETRYYLNGLYLHAATEATASDEVLVAVATDGHRLAKVSLALPAGEGGTLGLPTAGIIVPRQALGLIEKIIAKEPVQIALSESKILLRSGSVTLLSKLIDGTFPDYRRVIPAANPNRFHVQRTGLHSAVDRVGTVSPAGRAMRFTFGAASVALRCVSPDAGEGEDEVTATRMAGDDVESGFNGRYCLDMLSACPGDLVEFELGDPGAPALMRPAAAHALSPLFVIMPMRV